MSSLELVPMAETQIEVHGFSEQQQQALQEALPTNLIKERKGPGGRMLKYISGKTSIDAANRIFGFGKWGYRVLSKSHEKCGDAEYYTADIELFVIGCPFPFPGEGVGVVTSNNVEGHEKARKEAVTDAMKRALRHFGDQFGLCLYSEDALVEDAQGNLIQVKDAHAQNGNGNKQQSARRTVDAVPPEPQPTEAPRQTHHAPLVQAMLDARQVGMITGTTKEERTASWEEQVIMIFGKLISAEEQAKAENIAKINAAITRHKGAAKSA